MSSDPHTLRTRWLALCEACGLQRGEEAWKILDAGYSETTRYYHNWAHIADCLVLLDAWRDQFADAIAVELAFWFHDVVYDSQRGDNEEKSAIMAENYLKDHASAARVGAMVRATTHRAPSSDADTALLCDIDLSILAADVERYDAYARAIRQEYAWVSESDYGAGRGKVLQAFLNRAHLYSSELGQMRWESAARGNIARELQALTASA